MRVQPIAGQAVAGQQAPHALRVGVGGSPSAPPWPRGMSTAARAQRLVRPQGELHRDLAAHRVAEEVIAARDEDPVGDEPDHVDVVDLGATASFV